MKLFFVLFYLYTKIYITYLKQIITITNSIENEVYLIIHFLLRSYIYLLTEINKKKLFLEKP